MKNKIEEERIRKGVKELLKLYGVIDDIDDDVFEECIKLMPPDDEQLISMVDLMKGVQKIKDKMDER